MQTLNWGPVYAGDLPGAPSATFSGLPSEKILTLNMDVPEAWLVEPVKAELDLDNLRLADLGQKRSMHADFELESLILSGSCIDVAATSRAQVWCLATSCQDVATSPLAYETLMRRHVWSCLGTGLAFLTLNSSCIGVAAMSSTQVQDMAIAWWSFSFWLCTDRVLGAGCLPENVVLEDERCTCCL